MSASRERAGAQIYARPNSAESRIALQRAPGRCVYVYERASIDAPAGATRKSSRERIFDRRCRRYRNRRDDSLDSL